MRQINHIQATLRDLLKDGRIEETIDTLDKYLKNEKITDRHVSDSLITISASYRGLIQLHTKDTIDYGTYTSEKNKIIDRILSLIRDLPFIKPKENKRNELIEKQQSIALVALDNIQENNILDLREELLSVDNLIINLFKEISEKDKQLIRQKSEAQIAVLKKEKEILEKRIEEEEKRYNDLKKKYEELKEEREKIGELTVEIEGLKAQLQVKNDHISVLEERFIYSDKLLKQKETEINDLKLKIVKTSSESIVLNKRNFWIGVTLIGLIIVFLLAK